MPSRVFAEPEGTFEPSYEPEPVDDDEAPLELTEIAAPVATSDTDGDVDVPIRRLNLKTQTEVVAAPVHFSWADGPLHDDDGLLPRSRSMTMPVLLTVCGPRAKPRETVKAGARPHPCRALPRTLARL